MVAKEGLCEDRISKNGREESKRIIGKKKFIKSLESRKRSITFAPLFAAGKREIKEEVWG